MRGGSGSRVDIGYGTTQASWRLVQATINITQVYTYDSKFLFVAVFFGRFVADVCRACGGAGRRYGVRMQPGT